ncbi:molybdenum cofactor guanylyltransferase [Sphingomonas sp. DT-204]|uniref:molybdenum cofactor guanylyltransferase n=1 Tax=Sphingomonas sp. DT-204 TaxID=3396166 RepID=UPI003F1AF275
MPVLGAILAGGRSRRFGSDKALALHDGRALLDHAMAALAPQIEALVVCGREWPGITCLADRPHPGMGPLAGLAAALRHALTIGCDAVLCVPVDVHPLPANLRDLLADKGPAVLATQYAVGFWPASLIGALDAHLADGHRSFRSWIERTGPLRVDDGDLALGNINMPDDLIRLRR